MRFAHWLAVTVSCGVPVTVPTTRSPPVVCPSSGDGSLDLVNVCVFSFCLQHGWGSYATILGLIEEILGPADSCDPVPTAPLGSGWRICRWGEDYEVGLLFDNQGQPSDDVDSTVFSVPWTLRTADVQTSEGLAVGVPLACFEDVLGAGRSLDDGGVRWSLGSDGESSLEWYPDRLDLTMSWSE